MKEELAGYDVLASVDGVNFQVLATTPSTVTSYVHTNPLPDEEYSYQIRAVNEDGTRTSSSCVKTILSRTYPKPDFVNILSASVIDNSFIRVDWEADPDAPILRFEVERRAADEPMFTIQQTLQDDVNYNPGKTYSDLTADFGSSSYEYRIVMWDSCGMTFTTSAIHQTVHLSGQPFPDYTNRLQWNAYLGWDNGVERYNIYRSTDGTFSIIDDVDGNTTSFSDDVSSFSGTGGVFQYYVEAVENQGNNVTSKSNHITLEMETRVIVPNAFIPDGMPPDNEFKPIVSFIADGSYEMLIFNKWGQMIFTTTDSNEGWDGKQNGEILPPGAYVYLIKYRTPEGANMEQRGTVTIIR
jgi:gliding motility-associated-like protein